MPIPPQFLHRLFCTPCLQMLPPPQSLQRDLTLKCSHIPLPPQSLHWLFCLLWMHQRLPPHSLHRPIGLPCAQDLTSDLRLLRLCPSLDAGWIGASETRQGASSLDWLSIPGTIQSCNRSTKRDQRSDARGQWKVILSWCDKGKKIVGGGAAWRMLGQRQRRAAAQSIDDCCEGLKSTGLLLHRAREPTTNNWILVSTDDQPDQATKQ